MPSRSTQFSVAFTTNIAESNFRYTQAVRYEDQVEPAHVEQRIYSGFASNADLARMHAFHDQDWQDRIGSRP